MSWRMLSVDSLSKCKYITVAARGSPLSRVQVEEVYAEFVQHHPDLHFERIWVETRGDRDLETSLKKLDKTDFFTREIDILQLKGGCRISIHSAKDLPEPLPKGLSIVALTRGLELSDSLVLREGETLRDLLPGASIGVSSDRREKAVHDLREDLRCVDIRGSIDCRLALLDAHVVDGIVIAEAALIRLQMTHRNRLRLAGPTAPLQGQLAILAREGDEEMKQLFSCIDAR